MNVKTIIRGICFRILPETTLQSIKKFHYARILRSFSENNEKDFKVIRHLVNPGDWVIDIGANVGVYTKYLSELVNTSGRVYSIEPISPTFDILCFNIKKFRLRNVEALNICISDENGIVAMEVPLYELGGENFYEARIVSGGSNNSLRRVKVKSKTIDSLFSELSHKISFIKCDVEGHELQCIRGAINIIKESKPAWLIEISGEPDNFKSTVHETFELLAREGYEPFWFDGARLNKWNLGDKSVNYFFLTSKHLQSLQKRMIIV